MHADLVGAAGLEAHVEEGVGRVGARAREKWVTAGAGLRPSARRCVCGRARGGRWARRSCRVVGQARRSTSASSALDVAARHGRDQAPVGDALRATISRPEVSLSSRCTMPGRDSGRRRAVVDEAVDERAVLVARRRVDDDPGRLVDDQEIVVLVDEAVGDRLDPDAGAGRDGDLVGHRLTGVQNAMVLGAGLPSSGDQAGGDQPLGATARERPLRGPARRRGGLPSSSCVDTELGHCRVPALCAQRPPAHEGHAPRRSAMSATLKFGHGPSGDVVDHVPQRRRSMRLPSDPPTIKRQGRRKRRGKPPRRDDQDERDERTEAMSRATAALQPSERDAGVVGDLDADAVGQPVGQWSRRAR